MNNTQYTNIDEIIKLSALSETIAICGLPRIGKTHMLISILQKYLEQNKKCAFFSLGESKELFIQRLVAQKDNIVFTNNLSEKDWKNLSEAMNIYTDKEIYISDDIYRIEEVGKNIKEIKPDYVFIDYLQLVEINCKKDRLEQLYDIMTEFRNIANENNCTIFVVSQFSSPGPKNTNKKTSIQEFRERNIIEKFDKIFLIHRDFNTNLSEQNIEIIVAKDGNNVC